MVSDRADGGKDMLIAEPFRRPFDNKEAMAAEYGKWRESIPVKEFPDNSASNKTKQKTVQPECDLTASELMLKVLAYSCILTVKGCWRLPVAISGGWPRTKSGSTP